MLEEFIAFLPPPAFHISGEAWLANATAAGKQAGYEYLTTVVEAGAFVAEGPLWTGPWASRFQHVKPGFSAFLDNCIETSWFVDDKTDGVTTQDATDRVFKNVRERGSMAQ